jgi:hypothetical protein
MNESISVLDDCATAVFGPPPLKGETESEAPAFKTIPSAEWGETAPYTCTGCRKLLYPLYRHHCRVCGDFFCTACVKEFPKDFLKSTPLCKNIPAGKEQTLYACSACHKKATTRHKLFRSMDILRWMMPLGFHASSWRVIGRFAPTNSALGAAARYMLHTWRGVAGERARAAATGYRPTAVEDAVVLYSGPKITFFDLVYATTKLGRAVATKSISVEMPLELFISVLNNGKCADRWIVEEFVTRFPQSVCLIYPFLHPRVRKTLTTAALLTPLQRRAVYMHKTDVIDAACASFFVTRVDKMRTALRDLSVIASEESLTVRFGMQNTFHKAKRHVPFCGGRYCVTGTQVLQRTVKTHAMQIMTSDNMALHVLFYDTEFHLLRAAAFMSPAMYNTTFQNQMRLPNDEGSALVSLYNHKTSTIFDAPSAMSQASTVSINVFNVLLSLVQAVEKQYVNDGTLRCVLIDNNAMLPHLARRRRNEPMHPAQREEEEGGAVGAPATLDETVNAVVNSVSRKNRKKQQQRRVPMGPPSPPVQRAKKGERVRPDMLVVNVELVPTKPEWDAGRKERVASVERLLKKICTENIEHLYWIYRMVYYNCTSPPPFPTNVQTILDFTFSV